MESQAIVILNDMKAMLYNNKAKKIIANALNKDIVIFLGNTRSGKSTVVNYVIGTPLKSNAVRANIFNISKENQASPGPAIGMGSVSETSIPTTWTSPRFSSLIVDTPGFQDNRGEAQDVANSFYVKEIISNANTAKFVLISDISDILSDNITPFITLTDSVHRMLALDSKINPSIIMVFTKDRDNATKEDIAKILKEKIIDQPNIQVSNRALIDHLVSHPNQIALVNMPKREGRVNDVEVFGNLINTIETQASKLNKDVLVSVAPGLSDKSRNFLLQARQHFTEIAEFDQLMAIVQNHFTGVLAEFENLNNIKYSAQIPPMKNRLTGVENNVKTIQNPSWNAKQLIQKMSTVFPEIPQLKDEETIFYVEKPSNRLRKIKKDRADIYTKIDFIAFVDSILNLNESNIFKVKVNAAVNQMLNRINTCRSKLNDKQAALQDEENTIRLQQTKEENDRQAELQRQELERLRQIQLALQNQPSPQPHPVDRVVNNVIVRPVNTVYKPIERVVKKCSIM